MQPHSFDRPMLLTPARAWRTYIGGSRIDAIHGKESGGDGHFPEDWIMSVVAARNTGREAFPNEGMNFLAESGCSLADYIAADPNAALSSAHVEQVGATPGVLLKVIDAAERLTIQVHPDKAAARRLFHSEFGKTECWHILGGRKIGNEKPCVYIGFVEGVTRELWKRCFDEQDIAGMLRCLHRFDVSPEQTILIRGGVPHAIGCGCLLIEVQEPTDYSVRTERTTPSGLRISDFMCHQGVGFDAMFDCFDYAPVTANEAKQRWFLSPKQVEMAQGASSLRLVGYDDTPCFSLFRHEIPTQARFAKPTRFSGLYILSGSGELRCGNRRTAFSGGDQFFVPAASGAYTIVGYTPVTLFECCGPQTSRH